MQKVLQHAELVVHGESDEEEACGDDESEEVRVVLVVPDTTHDIVLGDDTLGGVFGVGETEDEDFGADVGLDFCGSTGIVASAVAFGLEAFLGVDRRRSRVQGYGHCEMDLVGSGERGDEISGG